MRIHDNAPLLDSILDSTPSLGKDFLLYKNHCYRVLNFCLAFLKESDLPIEKVSIVAAFHDIGIWMHSTYDYLEPSRKLAHDYLILTGHDAWASEVDTAIKLHHKLSRYKKNPEWLVEAFRRADWIDVTGGKLRFGLANSFIAEIYSRFPRAGFHSRMLALTRERFCTHPFSPLPMMRL